MGLITEELEVGLNSITINHYRQLGYKIQKIKNKWGQYTVPVGTRILINVKDLPKNSNIYIKIICDCCGIEKETQYGGYLKCVHKDNKYYCKECGHKLFAGENARITKLKNGKSFEQWCIENNRQDILDRWDCELNDKKPNEIGFSTNKKNYFKCPRELHKSELKNINDFANKQEGSMNCNQCQSFAQYIIDNYGENALNLYWDYDKNTINPWEVGCGTVKKVWIKCQEKDYHESYNIACVSFMLGNRCHYCNHMGDKVHPLDSLGKLLEDKNLLDIWSKNNKKSSYDYMQSSGKKVLWRCLKGHKDYKRSIAGSNICDFRCPECVQERNESFLQEKMRLYLENLNDINCVILHENKCTLNPKNIIIPPSKRRQFKLRYDNEVIINKNKHLFIEVMGQQHSFITFYTKLNSKHYSTTPQQEFDYQIAKDKFKEQYVYDQGKNYYYLAVWYYEFDSGDIYKQLVDDKIKEILNN